MIIVLFQSSPFTVMFFIKWMPTVTNALFMCDVCHREPSIVTVVKPSITFFFACGMSCENVEIRNSCIIAFVPFESFEAFAVVAAMKLESMATPHGSPCV